MILVLFPETWEGARGIDFSRWALLVGTGVLSMLSQIFMTEGYRSLSVATGSSYHLSMPALVAIASWFLFGERLGLLGVIGTVVILAGTALAVRNRTGT